MRKDNDEIITILYDDGFDDSEFFEGTGEIFGNYDKEIIEIILNAHEEYLKELDNEKLNSEYKQYLKENNINRKWDK